MAYSEPYIVIAEDSGVVATSEGPRWARTRWLAKPFSKTITVTAEIKPTPKVEPIPSPVASKHACGWHPKKLRNR
jgi:hypothetical protein